jgi:RNA polymerase sigma factor (TIGR02999 family)
MTDVTRILNAAQEGKTHASETLIPVVYAELRRLAAYRLAQEKPGQTLQATALVHEAYLRLVESKDQRWESRQHFFGAASEAMRRILVEVARRKSRVKHGANQQRVDVDDIELPMRVSPEDVLAVDEALEQLDEADPQAGELVRLRFFAGLTEDEASQILGISRRTAGRIWEFARAWLARAILPDE